MVFILLIFGLQGLYEENHGSLVTYAILIYAFTSCKTLFYLIYLFKVLSGYITSKLYRYLGGK